MDRQATHKLTVICLLLIAFSIPFFLERGKIGSLNSAYVIGVQITNNAIAPASHQGGQMPKDPTTIWVQDAGISFIGENALPFPAHR